MSLKKVLKKVFATQIVVSMLYSNFYLCGLGIANVIAQDIKEPKIVTNLENIQYVQFNEKMDMKNNEEEAIYKSGVAIKSKVEVALEEQEQELQLPIKGTELVIGLPVMNGYLPVRANVVRANTILTTGEENKNINQNYDLNSGLLTMSIQNQVAYSKYNKDSKDEFEIIYIYPAEAYTGNEEEKVLQYLAKIKTIFETENGEITSEKVQGFELKEKDNKGELVEFNITKLENPIYKGFMYSNIENGTKYETDYNTTSTLSVLNHDIEENLVMEIKENNFVLNNDKNSEISTSGRTIYKSTQIDKEQFDKILGQDGIIEIYNGENLLATVSYIAVNEKEEIVNKLAVIYSDDDIKILTPEEKIAKIEYGENITSLLIKTTKPIAEGYLNFKNQNAIIAANDYIVSVEDIKSIKTVSVVNEIVRDAEMLLFEPETKVKVNSSNMNFSTLKINKTTLTINLDSTNVATKLFDNPILEIELPEGIVSGNVSSPSIINGNGLKIKGDVKQGKASNIIIIELEGKQTKYNLKNVSGGTAIVMDIENLDYEDTIPAHIDTISVTCIQEDEKVVAKQDVNIVSKAGLFMFSKTNINNITETATNINGEIKEISISEDENKKQMKQTVCFVNNYGNDLENFQVIGRLAYSDSKFNSTIDVNLSKEIVVDKEGAEVYYSANQNADYNDASWSKEFNKESKAYKVVLKDNKLLKEDNLFVDIYAEIPEQLGYNQTIALKTQGIYSYNNSLMEENIITKMVTPRVEHMIYSTTHSEKTKVAENLPIEIGTTALIGGEEITEETVVNEGQIIRYIVSLKNNSNEKISSIDLKTQIKNAVYYELGVIGYSSLNSGEGSKGYVEAGVNDVIRNNTLELEPNETKTINYQIVVGAGINSVENLIVISKDNNIIYENNVINNVKESRIKLKLKSVDNEEVLAYSESMHSFIIEVTNLTTNDIKNVKAYCILPPEISYDIENWEEYFLGNQAENFDNIYMRDNILYFDINTLSAGRTNNLYIWAKIGSIENNISKKDVSLVARVEENGNIYTSNDLIKTIHQSNYNLISNMTSITPVEKTLKNGDEIIFKVTMENGGMLTVEKASLNMKTV